MISHSPSSAFDMFSSLKLVGWLSGLERSLWWISGKVFTGRLYIHFHTLYFCSYGLSLSSLGVLAFSVGWFGWFCIWYTFTYSQYTYKHLGIRKRSCHWRYKPSFNYIYLHIQIHAVVFSVAAFDSHSYGSIFKQTASICAKLVN